MDVLFLMSNFRLYSGLKRHLNTIVFAKIYFPVHVSVGILDFLYVRWTKKLNLVEPLVMATRTWTWYFANPKYSDYMRYYMMLLEGFDYEPVKTRPLLYDWSRSKLLFAWSLDWNIILSLHKNLPTLHFRLFDF